MFITIPIRFILKYTRNYTLFIASRKTARFLLYFLCIAAVPNFLLSTIDFNLSFHRFVGQLIAILLFSIPYYYFVKLLLGFVDFYDANYIDKLDFFILYLRSFKDDDKSKNEERKLMKLLYNNWSCPVAVGKPREFFPINSAMRIYIGENWKESVLTLMKKSQIILLRVSSAENFLWEFQQCILNKYLDKAIFWVTDKKEYRLFLMKNDIGNITFPELDLLPANSIFYFNSMGEYRICQLDNQEANFVDKYQTDHPSFIETYKLYFDTKTIRFSHLFKYRRDKHLSELIKWNWSAFFFPEFFLINQHIKHNVLWYFLLLFIDFLGIIFIILLSSQFTNCLLFIFPVIIFFIFRLVLMFCFGHNGEEIIWRSERWESVKIFRKSIRKNNCYTLIMGIILLFFYLLLSLNPYQ